jgi:chitodextrinase
MRKAKSLSLVAVVFLSISFTGCGGSDSGSSSSSNTSTIEKKIPTDVIVERGKVFEATVVDTENNTATQKIGQNIYTFDDIPKYPITATGGWIDIDNDGKKTLEDVELKLQMISYSTNITPITTYIADIDKSIREQKLQELSDKTGVSINELEKVVSKSSKNAMLVQNAVYKQIKLNDDNIASVNLDDIKNDFDSLSIISSQSPDKTGMDLIVLIEKEVVDTLKINDKITLVNDEDLLDIKIIDDILASINNRTVPSELNGATVVFNPSEPKEKLKISQTYDVIIIVTKGEQTKNQTFSETIDANQVPISKANADKISISKNDSVSFNATGSFDGDGSIISYEWKNIDTILSTKDSFSTSALTVGDNTITLTVIDNNGATNSDTVNITVNEVVTPNQSPTANTGSDQIVNEGDNVSFDGSSSSDSDGIIASYQWKEGTTILSNSSTFSKNDFTVGTHTITLTVTDNNGATNSDTVNITVKLILTTTEQTKLQIKSANTAGGDSSVHLRFNAPVADGELLLQFSIGINGWQYNITTSKYEWEDNKIDHIEYANSIIWIANNYNINTYSEFVYFFNTTTVEYQ